ncbi:MAG: hypothetical protein EOP09_09140 [Proteobacteria bacterium]|nr:MAG: hypothetical protein EOP09_09140 [Pseudomonadota bacterium]
MKQIVKSAKLLVQGVIMEQLKAGLDKILSNEITAFIFVFGCAVGAFIGVAGGYYLTFKTMVYLGAY